ncbi:hypothetical protein CLV60_107293 [Dyadobacter jiangsuensis]|uniref:VOC domain-containing protein n=2 Tax=Dyadobacter jiangsuensis TaxID=1591085 RepID=A0A2P8G215_9BACT|nr:hypothetical protein CLV60_107293 [Dyadobacter jiangsuensis]
MLAADDLPALRDFYTHVLGWEIEAANQDIAFFKLNGILLGMFGREDLAKFNNRDPEGSGFRPFNMALMVNSQAEVESIYSELSGKGVEIVQPITEPDFGGCYFLFADPEGNIWEISNNPFISVDQSGNVLGHQPIAHL